MGVAQAGTPSRGHLGEGARAREEAGRLAAVEMGVVKVAAQVAVMVAERVVWEAQVAEMVEVAKEVVQVGEMAVAEKAVAKVAMVALQR